MEVSAKYEGQQLEFQLSGELDHHGAKGLLDCLEREIAVALRGWQRMREVGGSVLLRHVAKQPRKVFEASGVGRMMTIE